MLVSTSVSIAIVFATFWHANEAIYSPFDQLYQQSAGGIGGQAQQCSFIEGFAVPPIGGGITAPFAVNNPYGGGTSTLSTGSYSAIWHTNCSGYVNFVINYKNFPLIGSFWIGIGFKLIDSVEMALIEVINGNVVTISQAKYYENQPPHRMSVIPIAGTSGILTNVRGAVYAGNVLEATFAIAEPILAACKEWTFYTTPTPIGAPYITSPYRRVVFNVPETCSIFDCQSSQRVIDQFRNYGASQYYRDDRIPPPVTLAEHINTNYRNLGQPQQYGPRYDDCYNYYNNNPTRSVSEYYNTYCPPSQYVVNGVGGTNRLRDPAETNQYYNYRTDYEGNPLVGYTATNPNYQYLNPQYSTSLYLDYYRKNSVSPPISQLLDSSNTNYYNNYNGYYRSGQLPYSTYYYNYGQQQSQLPNSNYYMLTSYPNNIYSYPSSSYYYPTSARGQSRQRREARSNELSRKKRDPLYMGSVMNGRYSGTAYEGQDQPYYGRPYGNDGYLATLHQNFGANDPRQQYRFQTRYRQPAPVLYDGNPTVYDTGIRNYDNWRGYWNYYDYVPSTFSRSKK